MLFAANSVRRSTHEQAIICVQLLTGEGVGWWHMIRQLDKSKRTVKRSCEIG